MNAPKAKKLTQEQGIKLIDAFNKSSLSVSAYCEQEKINRHVLKYWRLKVQKKPIPPKDGNLIPLKLISALPINILKVTLQNSVSIEIPVGSDLSVLKQVLEVCADVAKR